ncbi:MAG: bifunctional (p)ppGpp synthetase/guanosine-3',5'-bis(diphosphate) 3'-pyrophosphohydrolase [Firmicutes bacterium]|nr:bifunctional (p)ppGpp synthetase/guanosine-3',5'-bis(diphosphate) 3'-pyrophosphohydrolase [Bacillota bacterium]
MKYSKDICKALKIAYKAHEGQTDKCGMPYIFHPFCVAEQLEREDEIITALLHDVAEDTDIGIEELRNEGFDEKVIRALELLTRDKDTPYFDYVEKIKENEIASKVKIADLKHNSDRSRMEAVFGKIDEKAEKRFEKYRKALEMLEGIKN